MTGVNGAGAAYAASRLLSGHMYCCKASSRVLESGTGSHLDAAASRRASSHAVEAGQLPASSVSLRKRK